MAGLDAQMLRATYGGRRVLLTGHTGFKGGWLAIWLNALNARVTGIAQPPETRPSFFEDVGVESSCRHVVGDVRDLDAIRRLIRETKPEVIFHLAAQALVRRSYEQPIETLETNVMGTANVLEALRLEKQPCAVVVVTSDKCYENQEWPFGYRENEPMGGHDIYSTSKGAAELVVQGYRRSFFCPERLSEHGVAVASARAGNVIGGGDWAKDRIVPDAIRALAAGEPLIVRNPMSVRPWQHVLEPLGGYLLLGARLLRGTASERAPYCDAWNFGPRVESTQTVAILVDSILAGWGQGKWKADEGSTALHEAGVLRLATEKAFSLLDWQPTWGFGETVKRTVEGYKVRQAGASKGPLRELTERQISEYLAPRAAP